MNIIINEELELEILSKEGETISSYNDNAIVICGTLFGAYKYGRQYDRNQVLQYIIQHSNNPDAVVEMLRFSIGGFFLAIKEGDLLYTLSSTTCPDYFYVATKNKMIISNDEEYVYQYAGIEDLDEDEVIYNIVNRLSASPFNTVFRTVKRIVAGTILIIRPGLDFEQKLWVKKDINSFKKRVKESDQKQYQQFKATLESTAKIILQGSDKDIYVMISGIDSACQLIAFSKFAPQQRVHAISMHDGCFEEKVNQKICEQLGVPYIITPHLHEVDRDIDQIKSYFSGPFQYVYNHFHIATAEYSAINSIKKPLMITGNHTDDLYAVSCFNVTETLIGLYPLRSRVRRLFPYTKTFYRLLRGNCLESWRLLKKKMLKEQRGYPLKYNFYDFLLSILHPNPAKIVPLSLNWHFDNPLVDTKDFLKYTEASLLRPFINSQQLLEDLEKNRVDIDYFNHLVRTLSYIHHATNSYMPLVTYADVVYELMQPVSEGPLCNFFLNYQSTFTDSLFYKRFMYRYFEEAIGESYLSLCRKVRFNNSDPLVINTLRVLINKVKAIIGTIFPYARELYRKFKRRSDEISTGSNQVSTHLSQIELHYLEYDMLFEKNYKYFHSQDSVLLPLLKKEGNRQYVYSLYEELHSEEKPPLFEIRSIDSLAYVETYLRKRVHVSSSWEER